jgi:transcriptional regulator with XRE-family HTH domain
MQDFTATDREAIRRALREAKVTHDQIAAACAVSRPTITLWLSGDISSPALDKAIPAFAAALTHQPTV